MTNYRSGEILTTTKFDEICRANGFESVMDLARRVWSWKEKINDILMKQGLWLFTISPEHIKLVDVPEHIVRTTTFTRLAQEVAKHTINATQQLEYFKSEIDDRNKEMALSKIVWEMELPAGVSNSPMTYMANGKQYLLVAVSGRMFPGELVALALP